MYPWLRVMYAVVVIGSRIRKSACGMNLRTFCPCAKTFGAPSAAASINAQMAATELNRTCLFIVRLLDRNGCGNEREVTARTNGAEHSSPDISPGRGILARRFASWIGCS